MASGSARKPKQQHHRSTETAVSTSGTDIETVKHAAIRRSMKPTGSLDIAGICLLIIIIVITVFGNPGDWDVASKVHVGHVFYYGWITAISTGFGALPFFFISSTSIFWIGVSNAIAVCTP
jgi:ZIP family zinc transporter